MSGKGEGGRCWVLVVAGDTHSAFGIAICAIQGRSDKVYLENWRLIKFMWLIFIHTLYIYDRRISFAVAAFYLEFSTLPHADSQSRVSIHFASRDQKWLRSNNSVGLL